MMDVASHPDRRTVCIHWSDKRPCRLVCRPPLPADMQIGNLHQRSCSTVRPDIAPMRRMPVVQSSYSNLTVFVSSNFSVGNTSLYTPCRLQCRYICCSHPAPKSFRQAHAHRTSRAILPFYRSANTRRRFFYFHRRTARGIPPFRCRTIVSGRVQTRSLVVLASVAKSLRRSLQSPMQPSPCLRGPVIRE